MKSFFSLKQNIFEIIILLILSLTPLLWFKSGHIVIGIDSGYAVDYVKYFQQREYTWLASQNFGIDMSAEVGIVPYNSLPAIIKTAGVSEFNVQKILFVGWFFALLVSMYTLVRYLFPKKEQGVSRILAVIIYTFNLHIYSFWLQGEQPILASYVLLPLITFFLLKFIRDKPSPIKTAIYMNLVYLLFSSGGVRGVPLIGPVLVTVSVISLFFFLVNFKQEGFGYIKRFSVLIFWSLIFMCLVNAYYLLPFISSFAIQYTSQVSMTGGIAGAIDWTKFISTHTSIVNVARLQGDNNWYDKPFLWAWNYLTNPVLIILSFVFPISAFTAILIKKPRNEKRIVVLFTLISLLGIFFSAGAHPPLGNLYIFMMEHIPGFAAFRSAYYKFIPIVYLTFAVLIGITVDYALGKINKTNLKYIIGVIIIFTTLAYHYPYFTNSNFDFNKPFTTMVKIPQYIKEFAQFENSVPDRYRTLVLPQSPSAHIKAYAWGYWNSYPIFPLITDRGFVLNDAFVYNDNENQLINSIYDLLRGNNMQAFLNAAEVTNIKYILVTKDFSRDYSFSATENPQAYEKVLKNKAIFKKIWEKGPWLLYEIKSINPEKINVYDHIGISYASTNSISSILSDNFFPFASSSNIEDDASKIIKGSFRDFECLSCIISESNENPAITPPRVYPTSLFYSLKLSREKDLENVLTTNQKTNAYLGLSLKRLSELDKLNYVPAVPAAKWEVPAKLLLDNWTQIEKYYNLSYRNSNNYEYLDRILKYSILEQNSVQGILNFRKFNSKDLVDKYLISALDIIKRVHQSSNFILSANNWDNTFIYDISKAGGKIYIDKASLQRDLLGNLVPPSSYELDGKEFPYNKTNTENPSIVIPKGTKILQLSFNQVNHFVNPVIEKKVFNKEINNCITARISDYMGTEKYIISAKAKANNRGVIYIKRDYSTLKTQDLKPNPNQNLGYDVAAETFTGTTGVFKYPFTGLANDRGARVYFCVDKERDPSKVFSDIMVTTQLHPRIYSYKKEISQSNHTSSISYVKKNSTLYEVNINNATKPYLLTFSERYSPLWEAYVNNKKVESHFNVNGFANGWYITNTGSYNIKIVFKSQNQLQWGVAISVVSTFLLCSYLFIKRNERNKKN